MEVVVAEHHFHVFWSVRTITSGVRARNIRHARAYLVGILLEYFDSKDILNHSKKKTVSNWEKLINFTREDLINIMNMMKSM